MGELVIFARGTSSPRTSASTRCELGSGYWERRPDSRTTSRDTGISLAGLSGRAREIAVALSGQANPAYGWTTGQRKSAAPALVTVTSPASLAAKTASSDVNRYGVTPTLKVTRKTCQLPP